MLARPCLFSVIILYCLTILPVQVFSAAPRSLTPQEFLEKGAGVLVGEVADVQILGQEGNFKYGHVVIEVIEVLTGESIPSLATFAYHKQLGPEIINGCGWDFILPHLSVPERDEKLLIYFNEKDGTYYPHSAGCNSIEEISSFDDPKIKALRKLIKTQRHLR